MFPALKFLEHHFQSWHQPRVRPFSPMHQQQQDRWPNVSMTAGQIPQTSSPGPGQSCIRDSGSNQEPKSSRQGPINSSQPVAQIPPVRTRDPWPGLRGSSSGVVSLARAQLNLGWEGDPAREIFFWFGRIKIVLSVLGNICQSLVSDILARHRLFPTQPRSPLPHKRWIFPVLRV